MNIALRLIASIIVLVSMYLSSMWVVGAANSKATAVVLVCFVLSLEAAKACFVILTGQYHLQGKKLRSVAYGCMALVLMSMSFGASLSNLTTWKSAHAAPMAAIKLVDGSINQIDAGITAATKAVADGYVTSGTRTLTNLTNKRAALVKERLSLSTGTIKAETMTKYMLVTLSVSVEIVSFLCLLAVGHSLEFKTKVADVVKVEIEAETKPIGLLPQSKDVPSIRKIKSVYKCGYERAKSIQLELRESGLVHL